MNNDYEVTSINYIELYNVGEKLFNYFLNLKEVLNNFDQYIKAINDDKIWKGKGREQLLNHYLKERENFNLLYLKIKDYSKFILEYVQNIDEVSIKVNKMLEKLDEELLWPV